MSSAGINTVNSGPLIIRTALDSSSNNTYLVGRYDFPISTNYVLTTSTNGILKPSNTLVISSLTVNSLLDRDGSAGATGEVLHTDGSTAYWAPTGAGSGYWSENNNGTTIYNNNSGNVGINNTNPIYKLDVNGDLRVTNGIYVSSNGIQCRNATYTNSTDGGPYIYSPFSINSTCLYYYYNGSDVLQIAPPGNSGSIITFQTAKGGEVAQEHMKMDSLGSVNIFNNAGLPSSVNAPILTAEQQVGPYSQLTEFYNHAVLLTDVNYTTNMFMGVDTSTIANGSGYIQAVRRGIGPTSLVLNPQGGNVGIGTYNPSQKLEVDGTVYVSTGGLISNWNSWGNVKLLGGSFENAMLIQDGQNTTPGAVPPYNGYFVGVSNNIATASTFFITRIDNNVAQPTKSIYLTQTGNVGIGTSTPSEKLDIIGGSLSCSSIVNVSTINGAVYPPADDALWSGSIGGNIYNDNSGNVGIGTSAPAAKLHVQGSLSTLQIYDNNGSTGTSGQVLSAGTGGQVQWISQPVAPGTVIYEAALTYSEILGITPPPIGYITVSGGPTTDQSFLQYNYVPKSSSSKIYYTLSAPYYYSFNISSPLMIIKTCVNCLGVPNPPYLGATFQNLDALSSGALLPISGVYNNTSLSPIDITFYANTGGSSGSDLIIYYTYSDVPNCLLLNIHEIQT
jgi:hypothetical protein